MNVGTMIAEMSAKGYHLVCGPDHASGGYYALFASKKNEPWCQECGWGPLLGNGVEYSQNLVIAIEQTYLNVIRAEMPKVLQQQ